MAVVTEVLLRIKYQKHGEIQEDDILEDMDLYDALSDMEYQGIDYEEADSKLLRAKGRYLYTTFFEQESEQRENLFAVAREKEVEAFYYIFCNYSMEMDSIYHGIMKIDVARESVKHTLYKEEKYQEYLQKHLEEENKELLEEFQKFEEDELEDEDLDDFYEEVGNFMEEHMRLRFEEFLEEVNNDRLQNF